MISEALLLTDRLLLALLTGLYQGLLLSGVVWLCLKLSRRANAATRYAVWFLTLCVVAALPVVHLVLGMTNTRESALVKKERQSGDTISDSVQETQPEGHQAETEGFAQLATLVPPSETTEDGDVFDASEAESPPEATDVALVAPPQQIESETPTGGDPITTAESPGLKRFQPVKLPLTPLAGAIIMCTIAALAAGRSLALALQLIYLNSLRRGSEPAPDWLEHRFKMLTTRLGLKRRVELRVSDEVHSPMVLGFLPTTIVVPEGLLAAPDPARLDPLFRHELAHVSRFDDWLNLGQQAIKAFFAFHPAVLWISRRICTEREIACDDHVLQGGQKPRDYALLLTEFASRDRGRAWSAAPAAWSRKSQLSERVNMILRTDRSTSPQLGGTPLGVVTAGMTGCLIVLFAFAPRMTLGREPAGAASTSRDAAPVAPAVAATDCANTAIVIGDAPAVVAVPRAANGPRPLALTAPALAPGAVVYVHSQDGSIEERLQRVERLLERLLSEKSGPMHGMYAPAQPRAVTPLTPLPGAGFPMVAPKPAPMPEEFGLKEERDQIRRDARARAQGRQEPGRVPEREWKLKRGTAELMRERQALEARRQALEAQIAALEAQIERLESEQEKIEEERDRAEEERDRLEEQRQEQEEHEHDAEHDDDHDDDHDDEHHDKEKESDAAKA